MYNLDMKEIGIFIFTLCLFFLCCKIETLILKKEKINIKYIPIVFSIGFIIFSIMKIPLIPILCFPFLIGQCCIDFTKLELSDINNFIIFGFSILFGFVNEFYFLSFIIIGVTFFLLYLLPFSNMGFGDVKLLIATSLFVPSKLIPSYVFYILIISLIIGIVYKFKKKQNGFPMGPAISIMCFIIQIM